MQVSTRTAVRLPLSLVPSLSSVVLLPRYVCVLTCVSFMYGQAALPVEPIRVSRSSIVTRLKRRSIEVRVVGVGDEAVPLSMAHSLSFSLFFPLLLSLLLVCRLC